MERDLVIHRPGATASAELWLLFHGVGSSPDDLRRLGEALASGRPNAWIVSVRSPERSGSGWQWFSVQGVTEANRPDRVAAAMPAFLDRIGAWQEVTGVGPDRTTLLGFSQGAIMALESTQCVGAKPIATRVISIAGRFARLPRARPAGVTVHFLHGEQDQVMPVALAVDAAHALQALGTASTITRFAGLGHGIDGRVLEAIGRLTVAE